jgi:hypothetical protein
MTLRRIDIYAPHITDQEATAFTLMFEKREQYVDQGRNREAHGAGTMINILWKTLSGFSDTIPTLPAELDER